MTVERDAKIAAWVHADVAGLVDAMRRTIASPSLWVQLAHRLKDAGALAAAETAYRTAIRCDGTEWDPRLHLAHLLKGLDRLPEALELFLAIQSLPDGPNVDQEIAGLQVALRPENTVLARPTSSHPVAPTRDDIQTLLDGLLADLARAGIEGPASASASASPSIAPLASDILSAPISGGSTVARPRGLLSCATDLQAELMPKANLIIRDGQFVGTTANPQFDIRCGRACHPGWLEITVGIDMDTPVIAPVLYIEHAPQWQAFSTVRLARDGTRFMAVAPVAGPILSLRLDPPDAAGPFRITSFALKQIGLGRALRQAWRRDRVATRRALVGRRDGASGHDTRLALLSDALAAILANPALDPYETWIRRFEAPARLSPEIARRNAARWPKKPELSALVTWDPDGSAPLADTLASISAQSYPDWTLDIVTPRDLTGGEREAIRATAADAALHTQLAEAIAGRPGHHIVHVEAGDRLSHDALFRLAGEIFVKRGKGATVIYSDEDHIIDGQRRQPLFKPDWDPDFQAASGYVGRFLAIRQDRAMEAVAALSNTLNPGTAKRLAWTDVAGAALSLTAAEDILHIPEVLNHRHAAPFTPDAVVPAFAEPAGGWPHVTLMIPTRDGVDLLRACIASILDITSYPSLDILIVDNGSTQPETMAYFRSLAAHPQVDILHAPGPFNFSRLNNVAAAAAKGSVLGLVNNDILAIEPHWLKAMVTEAIRPEIGAVGAKLVYPSGHIQHAGMALGVGYVTAHPQKFRDSADPGYLGTLRVKRRVSTVTAACLIVERRKYQEVAGLDDVHLQVAFNDVDFCLKLRAAGYHNLFTPQAKLVHLESATRGLDMTGEKADRFRREAQVVLDRWRDAMTKDPYYSVNLTKDREDSSIRDHI